MHYILDEDNNPVHTEDVLEWGEWFKDLSRRTVAKDTVGSVNVSTVFIGLDYNFEGGEPILFETMVFGGELDQEEIRYRTWEEAEAGHKLMLERVKGD